MMLADSRARFRICQLALVNQMLAIEDRVQGVDSFLDSHSNWPGRPEQGVLVCEIPS